MPRSMPGTGIGKTRTRVFPFAYHPGTQTRWLSWWFRQLFVFSSLGGRFMRTSIAVGASLAIALLVGGVMAEEGLKSGLQPGDGCTPFEPKHVTGPNAGTARCLVRAYGASP